MNPEYKKPGLGKTLAGMLIGLVLAVLSPIVLMSEMLSLVMVILLPAVALVALNRWAGKGAALFSAIMQLMFSARFLGDTFMWMLFFLTIMPLAILMRHESKPFFTQIKISIAAFGTGILLAVSTAYFTYGGNMAGRVLLELPKLLRTLPAESLEAVMRPYTALLGNAMSAEEIYHAFDQMIHTLIPIYQMNLPGLIFGGGLITAVLCVALNGLMRTKQGIAAEGSYIPAREWALPGSATGGLLLIFAVSFILSMTDMPQGEAVFYAVYDICVAAFCIQAFSSVMRHMHISPLKRGVRTAFVVVFVILCIMGGSLYVSIFGVASAVFGSKGMLRERMRNKQNNNHSNGDK